MSNLKSEIINPPSARLFWGPFLAWTALAYLLAGGVGWLSWQICQAYPPIAKVGLWSLFVGVVLGAALVALAHLTRAGHRLSLVVVALLAATWASLAYHLSAYVEYRQNIQSAIDADPKAALAAAFDPEFGRPASFARFMAWESEGKLGYWILDATLIAVAAGVVVLIGSSRPYCNTCRSYYRTVRRGAVDPSVGQRIAESANLSLPADPSHCHWRFSSCEAGCGPPRLQLTWKQAGRTETAAAWLSAEQQQAIEEITKHEDQNTNKSQ
jgi:hypothetical protein